MNTLRAILLHPGSSGYWFWSGMGGAFVMPLVFVAASKTADWLLPTRCAQLGCRRQAVRLHPASGIPVCEKHL